MKKVILIIGIVIYSLAAFADNPAVDKRMLNTFATHITTNATTAVTSTTSYVSTIVVTCTAPGTTETVQVRNKEATNKVLYQSGTLVAGTTIIHCDLAPIVSTSGIEIVTAGGGAATVDVFISYWQ